MDVDGIIKGIVEQACEDYDTGKLRTANAHATFGDGGYLTFKEQIIAERAARLGFVAGMREAAMIADQPELQDCDNEQVASTIRAAADAIEMGE